MNQPQFTYSEPTKEEGEAFNAELQALIEKHSMVLVPVPVINYQKGNAFDAQINIMKKVELVPKAEGVPSPAEYIGNDNGGNDNAKTESGEEA